MLEAISRVISCSTNTFALIDWLIYSSIETSFVSKSSKYHKSQTIRTRELKFERMFTPYNIPHITCHMSCVTCHYFSFLFSSFFSSFGKAYWWRKLPRLVLGNIFINVLPIEEKSVYTIIYEHNKPSQMLIYS